MARRVAALHVEWRPSGIGRFDGYKSRLALAVPLLLAFKDLLP